MTKYWLAWGNTAEELIERVNFRLEHGWECQGGMTLWVSPRDPGQRMYYQPMVRK